MSEDPSANDGIPNEQPSGATGTTSGTIKGNVGFQGHLEIKVIRARRNTWWYKTLTFPWKVISYPFRKVKA